MSQEIHAVIFDFYGTLAYLAQESRPYRALFQDLVLSPDEADQARNIALTNNFPDLRTLVDRIKPDAKLDLRQYETALRREVSSAMLYPETKDVLETLRKKEIKIGLISNVASPYKSPFFDLEIDAYFDQVLFSCDLGMAKPDTEIYMRMASQLGVSPTHALMTGDKLDRDVEPPKSIGMQAILLDRESRFSHLPNIRTLQGVFSYLPSS